MVFSKLFLVKCLEKDLILDILLFKEYFASFFNTFYLSFIYFLYITYTYKYFKLSINNING